MLNEKNISKWLILLPIISILITSTILINIFIKNTATKHENDIKNIQSERIDILKKTLQDRIYRIINIINTENELKLKSHEKEIENFVQAGYKIIESTYNHNKNLPKEMILEKIKEKLTDIRFFENQTGYFYIHSLDGTCIMMPPQKSLEGKDLLTIQSQDGSYIFKEPFEQVYKLEKTPNKEGVVIHYLQKPHEKNLQKKNGYIKIFEPLGIFIGTGKYFEDIQKAIKSDILTLLNVVRFDYYDYLFVTDLNGVFLAHKDSDMIGTKGKIFQNENEVGIDIARLGNSLNGNFITYKFQNPLTHLQDEKISFVKSYDPFGWVIGTGTHTKIIEDEIANEKAKMQKELDSMVKNIMIISLIVIALMIILLLPISYKIKNILLSREKELDVKNDELVYSNFHDELTNLSNRNQLLKDINDYQATQLLLIDIDNFSQINDIYGLKVGDKILKRVANIISTLTPNNYNLYRVTNDIFALLNKEPNSQNKKCSQVAYDVIELVNQNPVEITIDNFKVEIVLSVTLSMSESDGSDKLYEHANMALNFAKSKKKPFIIYSPELGIEKRYQDDLYSVMIVKKALLHNLIEPFFQPIIKHDGKVAFESLARIVDEGTVIQPAAFIDKIKTTKYYNELTRVL